jgi:hypothetical protein
MAQNDGEGHPHARKVLYGKIRVANTTCYQPHLNLISPRGIQHNLFENRILAGIVQHCCNAVALHGIPPHLDGLYYTT